MESLQPDWACSLVDTDVDLTWDYLTTPQSPPTSTTYTLTDASPSLHLTVTAQQDVHVLLAASSFTSVSIQGPSLCGILYYGIPVVLTVEDNGAGIPEEDLRFHSTSSISTDSYASSLFVETPFSVSQDPSHHP